MKTQRVAEALIVLLILILLVGLLLPNLGAARKSTQDMASAAQERDDSIQFLTTQQTFDDTSQIRPHARSVAGLDEPRDLAEPDRQIARSARMTVRVQDVSRFIADATALCEQVGGFVLESSHAPGKGRRDTGKMTLSVPAASLTEVMGKLRAGADELEEEQIVAKDVTDAVFDLDARLTNLRAAEERLRAILTEIKAQDGSAKEVIEVFRELTDLRGQIERLEAQARDLRERVRYATVTLRVHGPEAALPAVAEPEMGPAQTWDHAVATLKSTLRWLLNTVIFVGVAVLPVVVLVLVPVLLVAWLVRKSGRGRGS